MAVLKDLNVEITDWTKANAGTRMRAFLEHTRKNHMQMAIFLGVSVTTISRWANGHHIPDFRARRTIQHLLEMDERGMK